MKQPFRRLSFVAVLFALFAGGCAAKRIVSQWRPIKPASAAIFEDQLASALRAIGIDAVPNYRYLPEDGERWTRTTSTTRSIVISKRWWRR